VKLSVFESTRRLAPELTVLALGALAFVVDVLVTNAASARDPATIVVPSAEAVARSPAVIFGDEIASAEGSDIDRWIRGEILYREALRLGLDQDDIVVRRRLIQKMEYVLDGMAAPVALTDEQVESYYAVHAERYLWPAGETFTQIFFAVDGGDTALRRADEALLSLHDKDRDAGQAWGDPYPDGARVWNASADRLQQTFGADFAAHLQAAPMHEWSGPIRSRIGAHLVFREQTHPPRQPPLSEIRGLVARDLLDELRLSRRAEHYRELAARYSIRRPADSGPSAAPPALAARDVNAAAFPDGAE
jgi:hypothetical protein